MRSFFKRLADVCFGVIVGLGLAADIVLARSIDPSKAGVSLWIFVVVGAFIVLLQLIPAFILFTGFIAGIHKSVKVKEPVTEGVKEVG